MSATEIAAMAGVAKPSVESWQRNSLPRLDYISQLAEAANISLDWFAGRPDANREYGAR